MPRLITLTHRFRRAYRRLPPPDQERADRALRILEEYFRSRTAPPGLGLKKLGDRVYEIRAGLALRIVWVEDEENVFLSLLGTHDEVFRFLERR